MIIQSVKYHIFLAGAAFKAINLVGSFFTFCRPCSILQAQLHPNADEDGGLACRDQELLEKQRRYADMHYYSGPLTHSSLQPLFDLSYSLLLILYSPPLLPQQNLPMWQMK